MFSGIKELKSEHFATTASTLFACITPGFLCLYLYKPDLISSLDIFKLVVFSMALMLPLLFTSTIAVSLFADKIDLINNTTTSPFVKWLIACVVTGIIANTTLYFASYLFQINFKNFTFIILSIESIFLAISFLIFLLSPTKK